MENQFGLYSPGSSGWTWMRNEEFQEEDVWEVLRQLHGSISKDKNSFQHLTYMPKDLQSPAILIPTPNDNSSSSNSSCSQDPELMQHRSAPLNIPDWPKIYGTNSTNTCMKPCLWLDADSSSGDENVGGFARSNIWDSDVEEEEDDDDGDEEQVRVIPPHEWIANKRQPSFSVCEGAGRTLKGRDLRKVRNSVLTRTGFLESKSNAGSVI